MSTNLYVYTDASVVDDISVGAYIVFSDNIFYTSNLKKFKCSASPTAEMEAFEFALEYLKTVCTSTTNVFFYTDSKFVIQKVNERDLAEELKCKEVSVRKVHGHKRMLNPNKLVDRITKIGQVIL